jgi:hypothetical protein
MANTFAPYKPETNCVVKITKREANLLQRLRRFTYGEAIVFKANNVIVRVETKISQMIDEEGDIELDD